MGLQEKMSHCSSWNYRNTDCSAVLKGDGPSLDTNTGVLFKHASHQLMYL